MGRELGQSVVGKRKGALGKAWDGPSHGGKSAKGPGESRQALKASRHGYNQEKNQGINVKSQVVLLNAWKISQNLKISTLIYFSSL